MWCFLFSFKRAFIAAFVSLIIFLSFASTAFSDSGTEILNPICRVSPAGIGEHDIRVVQVILYGSSETAGIPRVNIGERLTANVIVVNCGQNRDAVGVGIKLYVTETGGAAEGAVPHSPALETTKAVELKYNTFQDTYTFIIDMLIPKNPTPRNLIPGPYYITAYASTNESETTNQTNNYGSAPIFIADTTSQGCPVNKPNSDPESSCGSSDNLAGEDPTGLPGPTIRFFSYPISDTKINIHLTNSSTIQSDDFWELCVLKGSNVDIINLSAACERRPIGGIEIGVDVVWTANGLDPGTTYYFHYRRMINGCSPNNCIDTWSPGYTWTTTATNLNLISPPNKARGVAESVTLSWQGGNFPGQPTSYTLYWEQESPISLGSTTSYTRSGLREATTYSWRVEASWLIPDFGIPLVVKSPTFTFTTKSPPNMPSIHSPPVGAGMVGLTPTLIWNGGDPDGDAVTYDVYLGKELVNNCPLRDSDRTCAPFVTVGPSTANSFSISPTISDTSTYYWQVKARSGSHVISGPIWWFFTVGHSFQVSDPGRPATRAPEVAYSASSGNFLTVWEDRASQIWDIRGALVRSSDGAILQQNLPINIRTDLNRNAPVVASNGTNFLVVWWDARPDPVISSSISADIYGALVSGSNGSVIRNDILISSYAADCSIDFSFAGIYIPRTVCPQGGAQTYPAITYDPVNGNYFVVWMDTRSGNNDIYGTRVRASDGTILDQGNILISNGTRPSGSAATQQFPAVTYGAGMFWVTWEDDRNSSSLIIGARVRASDGALLDPNGVNINIGGIGRAPSSAFDGTNFLTVWQDSRNIGNDWDIMGTLVRPSDGAVLMNVAPIGISVANGAQTSPQVEYGNGNFFVVWEDLRDDPNCTSHSSGCDWNTYGAWVRSDGMVLDKLNISLTKRPGAQLAPAMAFGNGTHFTPWEDYGNGVQIFGQGRTNANAFRPGLGYDVTAPSIPAGFKAVAINSTQIDLSWLASVDDPGGVGLKHYSIYRCDGIVQSCDSGIYLGDSMNLSFSSMNLTPNTSYTYAIVAIDGDANISTRSYVSATTLSNIDLFSLFSSGAAFSRSDTVAVTTAIRNDGGSTNGPFVVKYYLSTSRSIDNATLLSTRPFPGGLAAQSTLTESFLLPIPAGTMQRSYFIATSIDADNQVTELDEENNLFFLPVTIDDTPPMVILSTPTGGSEVCCTVQVLASASDNIGVQSVVFFVDGVLAGMDTDSSDGWSWSWYTVSFLNGTHMLTAQTVDKAGNVGVSGPVNVHVQNPLLPPTALSVTDMPGDQGGALQLTWTVSPSVGATQQRLYRRIASGGPYSLLPVTLGKTISNYIDTGLIDGETYYYVVRAFDGIAESPSSNESGDVPHENIAPVISNITSSSITSVSATLSWSTNEVSDSQVEYGPTINYGSSSTLNTMAVTSHSVMLSDLNPSTLYHYRVKSRDISGNLNVSSDFTFITGNSLAAGDYHTCAVLANGTVNCWGANGFGQLGDGTTANRSTPVAVSEISTAKAIAAGGNHTCAVLANGTVSCWGNNDSGQLGDGTIVNHATPVAVSGISTATAIAAGGAHTCALLANGTVTCWGYNFFGQLGDGTIGNRATPVAVNGISTATAIAAGSQHTCAVISNGTVSCWGYNFFGQLGDGTTNNRPMPITVGGISTATAISSRSVHTCVLLSNGTVNCWGDNSSAQLGDGTTVNRSTPVVVGGISPATEIAAGGNHTCALLLNGTVSCWGRNEYGMLGNGMTSNPSPPVTAVGINTAAAIVTGGYHTCALLSNGTISCWGLSYDGQLGNGTSQSTSIPVTIVGASTATAIAAGGMHTCALSNGTVNCWGKNHIGQLGNGTTNYGSTSPVAVSGISTATAITAGGNHTCALLSNSTVSCWGFNNAGQLGDGTTIERSTPVPVSGITATAIAAGGSHTCALLSNGTVSCWGSNQYGQLGNGTTGYGTVWGISTATAIAAGGDHTCALLSNGTVSCWGNNQYGQLGNGTTSYGSTSPVPVSGISTVTAIAAGGNHTCAFLSNGTVSCWGLNQYGQLGNGTTVYYSPTPSVAVSGISTATAIAAGVGIMILDGHTCALLSNGTVSCWGNNQYGQLGNGTTSYGSTSPVPVSGISTVTAITAGGNHTCALLSNGTVSCWGYNNGYIGTFSTPGEVIGINTNPILVVAKSGTGAGSVTSLPAGIDCNAICSTPFAPGASVTLTAAQATGSTFAGFSGGCVSVTTTCTFNVIANATVTATFNDTQAPAITNVVSGSITPTGATITWATNEAADSQVEYGLSSSYGNSTPLDTTMVASHTLTLSGLLSSTQYHYRVKSKDAAGNPATSADFTFTTTAPPDTTPPAVTNVASGNITETGATITWTTDEASDSQVEYGATTAYGSSTTLNTAAVTSHSMTLSGLSPSTLYNYRVKSKDASGNLTTSADTTFTTTPGPSSPASTFTIAAGTSHSCARLANGTVTCWGFNSSGQLGNGTTTNSSIPVTVSGISTAVDIAAGGLHTCARLSDGTVKCWGSNGNGKLGNGSQSNSITPVSVTGISTATAIAAGNSHTCALLSDSTIKCWGRNGDGELGNGTNIPSSTPVAVTGINNATAVAVGNEHTCARLTDGTVKCWGYGSTLGGGTGSSSSTPVAVNGISTAVALASGPVGGYHTCALLLNGTVTCWGDNGSGQIGNGTTTSSFYPAAVSGISNATAIAVGNDHSCARLSDGTAKCWGNNGSGQLGNGTTIGSTTPVAVSGISTATFIATGSSHTCANLSDGTVKCWGANNSGQLGNGTTNSSTPVNVSSINTVNPILILTKSGSGTGAVTSAPAGITCGATCSTFIPSGTSVTLTATADAGSTAAGFTGGCTSATGTCTFTITTSVTITATLNDTEAPTAPSNLTVTAASSSQINLTWAVSTDNRGVTGYWIERCQGAGCTTFAPVNTTPVTTVTYIDAGLTAGAVYLYRVQAFDAVGNASAYSNTGSTTTLASSASTFMVAAGASHSCARLSNGTVTCWGFNSSGQLGNGTTTNSSSPVTVSGISTAVDIAAGGLHTCARLSDGTVKCWGRNFSGELGNAAGPSSSTPMAVNGVSTATAIAAGFSHTCALLSDGMIKCWGRNADGELGNGTNIPSSTPVAVTGINNATAIAVGNEHTCARLSDGTVKCWGYGTLGSGHSSIPVAVSGISTAVAVASGPIGGYHNCALLSNGTITCWGDNGSGQLGNGTTTASYTPVSVSGISNATGIAVGDDHSCARLSDGTAKCWGNNGSGRLGNGTTLGSTTPMAVSEISAATFIATGSSHTCANLSDGTVKCWGSNGGGQLGNGTTTGSSTPTTVSGINTLP